MNVTIRLFGPYAEAVKDSSVTLEMPEHRGCTAAQVMAQLARTHPSLSGMLEAAHLAVNHQVAEPEHPIRENDELAVIGLVSGG